MSAVCVDHGFEIEYLLFVDDKAIAVVEAKREENPLAEDVQSQAEGYATHPQNRYGLWYDGLIPLVYLANGSKIYFKNLLFPETDYIELTEMHSSKKMLQLIHQISAYGAKAFQLFRLYWGFCAAGATAIVKLVEIR